MPKKTKVIDSPPTGASADEGRGAVQYAALPYRFGPDGLRVLLITSRETRRWVIPKGWPMKGRKPHEAAAREAYEEAGLVGRVRSGSVGAFVYAKRLRDGSEVMARVRVFPFEVVRRKKRWPEKGERGDGWFEPGEAASLVDEEGLADILRDFAPRRRRKAGKAAKVKELTVPQVASVAGKSDKAGKRASKAKQGSAIDVLASGRLARPFAKNDGPKPPSLREPVGKDWFHSP